MLPATRDNKNVEEIHYKVDSSKGQLDVWLDEGGVTSVDFTDASPGSPSAEYSVRNEANLANCFRVMGIPQQEADELAQELWAELDQQERDERQRLRGWDEGRKDYKKRIARGGV